MKLSKQKFDTLTLAGTWNATTPEEQQFQALQAELRKMKQATHPNNRLQSSKTNKTSQTLKDPHNHDEKVIWYEKPNWKFTAPPIRYLKNPREATFKGKTSQFWWCSEETGGKCNGKWRTQKPQECKGTSKRANKKNPNPNNDNPKKKTKSEKAKLRVARAVAAIKNDSDSE